MANTTLLIISQTRLVNSLLYKGATASNLSIYKGCRLGLAWSEVIHWPHVSLLPQSQNAPSYVGCPIRTSPTAPIVPVLSQKKDVWCKAQASVADEEKSVVEPCGIPQLQPVLTPSLQDADAV